MNPADDGKSALPIAGPDDFAARFDVSRETIDRLETLVATLRLWQPRINLVAPSTLNEVWDRHIADSAQLVALAPEARRWIDIGSGAGFPGLVVAIMRHGSPQTLSMVLVESDRRKCAFLAEAARRCGVTVEIVAERVEKSATHLIVPPVDVVSARALAPLDRLLTLARPWLVMGAVGIFPKGQSARDEIEVARRRWDFEADVRASVTDPAARIVVVRRLAQRAEG